MQKHVIILLILQIIATGCADSERSAAPQLRETMPAGIIESPLDVSETLDVYAKLTGASMDVEDSVRKSSRIVFNSQTYPAMTKTQARDFLEDGLRAAGIVVIRSTNHVIFRGRKQMQPPANEIQQNQQLADSCKIPQK